MLPSPTLKQTANKRSQQDTLEWQFISILKFITEMQYQMNNLQEQSFETWKNIWELAAIGDSSAAEQIKSHIRDSLTIDNSLITCNFTTLLLQSRIHSLEPSRTLGPYELYSKVPTFLLLEGHIRIQCINLQGDTENIASFQKSGLVQLDELEMKAKFGQSNITLITQFQIVGMERSVLIEIEPSSLALCGKVPEKSTITLREEVIMKRYMIIALKHITKLTYSKGTPLNDKFYLLEGRACYYHPKTKTILCCYEEGIFNPVDLKNPEFKLQIFEGSYLLIFQSQMLKDEVVSGAELKRTEHIANIWKKYEKMSVEQKSKIQQRLIEKFNLNRKELEKQIIGIEKPPAQKRVKSKNDMINTSSSMKEKCGIRIRKSKKMS